MLVLKFVLNLLSKSLKTMFNQWFSVTTKITVKQQEQHVKLVVLHVRDVKKFAQSKQLKQKLLQLKATLQTSTQTSVSVVCSVLKHAQLAQLMFQTADNYI